MKNFLGLIVLPIFIIKLINWFIPQLGGNFFEIIQLFIFAIMSYIFVKKYKKNLWQVLNLGLAFAVITMFFDILFLLPTSFGKFISNGSQSLSPGAFQALFTLLVINIVIGLVAFLFGGLIGKFFGRKDDIGENELFNNQNTFIKKYIWLILCIFLLLFFGTIGFKYANIPVNTCRERAIDINNKINGNLDITFDFFYNSCLDNEKKVAAKNNLSENEKKELQDLFTSIKMLDIAYNEWRQKINDIPVKDVGLLESLNNQYKMDIENSISTIFDKINIRGMNLDEVDKMELADGFFDLKKGYNLKLSEADRALDTIRRINSDELSKANINENLEKTRETNSYIILGTGKITDVMQKNGVQIPK